jgi:ATP-dependent exoDNAse (exonuclease V) beta subunit
VSDLGFENLDIPHRLIRASAGSGKTYRLTGHYLELLRRGAMPDAILATTFTRKAAGEILGRIVSRLIKAARGEPESGDTIDRDQAMVLLRRLAAVLHRVGVSTLDSFFHRLGQGFRFELGLPLDPVVIDEGSATAKTLRGDAVEAVLADAAKSEESFKALLDLLRRLHHDEAGRSVTEAIDRIAVTHAEVYRQAPDAETWSTLIAPDPLEGEALEAAIQRWREMRHELPVTGKGSPRKHWQNSWERVGRQAVACEWEAMTSSGLLAAMTAGKDAFDRVEISETWIEAAAPFLKQISAVLIGRVANQTQATHAMMQRFVEHYETLRQRRGVMLYSDMTHRLAGGLIGGAGDDATLAEIAFRMDQAVTHLLLDEFQDTSLDQWQVLKPFADEIASYSDGSRSLFAVGDMKQAIYGWRGGCAALFDTVEYRIPPEGRETMQQSWRSSPNVLDAVNAVFSHIARCDTLTADPDDAAAAAIWADRFEPHESAKTLLPGYVRFEATRLPDVKTEASDDDETPGDHLAQVAEHIADLAQRAPDQTIGVLMRTNAAVHRMIYELRKRNVPASGEGGHPLAESPPVAAMLSAMVLADHPGDSASAFHVLNSPLGPLLDMHRLDEAPKVARSIRKRLLEQGYAKTIAQWMHALADRCDARGLRRLHRLVDLAEAWDRGPNPVLRPSRFVDHVESARVEEPGGSAVRVMTIHKSKGLEFEAVVLPELDKPFDNQFDVLIDRPDPTGPIQGVMRHANDAIRALSPELQDAYSQRRRQQREEDLCTLYVAMTRAMHGLYIWVKPTGTPRLSKLSPAAVLRDTLGDPDEGYAIGDPDWMNAAKQPDPEPRTSTDSDETLTIGLATPSKPSRLRPTLLPSSLHTGGRIQAGDLLRIDDELAMTRGTHWHELLAELDYLVENQSPPEHWPDGLRQMFKHDAVRQVFAPRFGPNETLWRERRFSVMADNRLVRGSFDRVAIDYDGQGDAKAAHLIDFKSDELSNDPAALAERKERYRLQLEAYRDALSQLLRLDTSAITAELLFLQPGVSVGV